ncbi:unnamed protein product [Penicillium pancosmium]
MRLSALRSSRIALQTPRQLRASVSSPQDSDVFANNLRKTLDAHRTSNRNRLIRKVYPRSPAAGLWRPEIPLESRPECPPATPPAPTVKEAKPKETTSRQRRRLRHEDAATRSTQSRPADTLIRSSETFHDGTTWNPLVIGLLNPIVPHAPQLIGSRRIGLALPHSDLNFFLPFEDLHRSPDRARKPSATRPQIHDAHLRLLRRVKSTLESSPSFDQIQLSGKRRSILEARHHPTGLLLRFHCGERAPELMDYLKNYLAQYPTLRPLYMATRALLEARSLFGYSQSGIRPDALAMLLVAFLKLNQSRFSVPFNAGEQFLTFLKFYGTDVDLQSTGIAVDPPGFFGFEKIHDSEHGDVNTACLRGQRSLINAKRTAVSRGNMPAGQRLCLQDPTHYMNDLGRSCTRTAELQNVFSTAYKQLCDSSQGWKDTDKVESILASALRANFDQLETLREKLVPSD